MKEWRGVIVKKLLYAASLEPESERNEKVESVLVGAGIRGWNIGNIRLGGNRIIYFRLTANCLKSIQWKNPTTLIGLPTGSSPMTDGTRIGVSWGPMIPWRGTAMLYAIVLIMLTLAACGGDSPDAGGNGTSTAVPQDTAEAAGAMPKPGQNGAKAKGGFDSVSAGKEHTCGVRDDGSVACWGGNQYGQATPPAGEFASVSAGAAHTCGVRTDGSVACWGATPPEGQFASVSAGAAHTCGVRTGGSGATVRTAEPFRPRGNSPPSAPGIDTPAG